MKKLLHAHLKVFMQLLFLFTLGTVGLGIKRAGSDIVSVWGLGLPLELGLETVFNLYTF